MFERHRGEKGLKGIFFAIVCTGIDAGPDINPNISERARLWEEVAFLIAWADMLLLLAHPVLNRSCQELATIVSFPQLQAYSRHSKKI